VWSCLFLGLYRSVSKYYFVILFGRVCKIDKTIRLYRFGHTCAGSDVPSKHTDPTHLSSTTIVSIVVAVLLVILVIVDVSCFFVNDTGLLHLMCGKSKKNKNEEDAKLGSEGKELLNNGHRDLKVQIESAPMIDKKDTTVEFDLKKATSKTSFVGKDSAV